MNRHQNRIIAFQALYSWDVGRTDLDSLYDFSWISSDEKSTDDEDTTKSDKKQGLEFARLLIAGTIENIDSIDEQIKSHLSPKWDFSRINKVSLAILRISVYSLLFQIDSTSRAIVIDEAVSIAKEFGPDDSYKFVNGLLDKIAKETENKGAL